MAHSSKPWSVRREGDLEGRSWDQLHAMWLGCSIPQDMAGRRPLSAAADLTTLAEVIRPLLERVRKFKQANSRLPDVERASVGQVKGLSSAMFHEALCLLLKAMSVSTACQLDFAEGHRTWSVSPGYQAAMFAGEAVMRLLGVLPIESDNHILLIDLCARNDAKSQRKDSSFSTKITWCATGQITHDARWHLLCRLVRVLVIDENIWNSGWIKGFSQIDANSISRQRHLLHYGPNSWLFDDLLEPQVAADFGSFGNMIMDGTIIDDLERDDYTIGIAFALITMCLSLFKHLASSSTLIAMETRCLDHWIANERGVYFRTACPSVCI